MTSQHFRFLLLLLICSFTFSGEVLQDSSFSIFVEEELDYVPLEGESVTEDTLKQRENTVKIRVPVPSKVIDRNELSRIKDSLRREVHYHELMKEADRLENSSRTLLIIGAVPEIAGVGIMIFGSAASASSSEWHSGFWSVIYGAMIAEIGIPFTIVGGVLRLKSKRLYREARYDLTLTPQIDVERNQFGGALSIHF